MSFSGAGVSSDSGLTFRDIGYINPGANPFNLLLGDPVVNCTSASNFYYSQIGSSGTASDFTSAIFLSKSTDGGFVWDDPVAAVSKSAITHFLDKDWSAIDPKHPRNIYVAYTDFEMRSNACDQSDRIAIEIVHSADGGITWSEPTVLDQTCSGPPDFPFVEDPQIVVDSQGRIYIEWEFFPTGQAGRIREFRIARSSNNAATFGPFSKIDDQIATGDGYALEGLLRDGITGNLAVDRSGTKTDGNLYFTWDDGRFASRFDFESPFGSYNFANVLLSRSTDGGKTWSNPVRVNNDSLASGSGFSKDHFQPGVAVDSTGAVAACWYDRRDAPVNYRVSRYCGVSTDQGASWTNTRVDSTKWAPVHATDAYINPYYLGDYDTVASDRLMMLTGFQGAYGSVSASAPVPNQDVFLVHLNK